MRISGRIEKRKPIAFPARLRHPDPSDSVELALTQNVSPRGVRLVTSRCWQAGEHLWIDCAALESPQRARVVYCQRGLSGGFFLGLQLTDPPHDPGELPKQFQRPAS